VSRPALLALATFLSTTATSYAVQAAPTAAIAAPVFAPSAFNATESDVSEAYPDVAAFCAAVLVNANVPRSQDTPDPNAPPRSYRTPSCKIIPVGASFASNTEFQAVRAVRVTGADFAYSTLLVKVPRGFVPMPLRWNEEDPTDPGCPSIVYGIGIERIAIEHGLLVVVALGEDVTFIDVSDAPVDSGARTRLVRQVSVARQVGESLHTRTFSASSGAPLGWKRQPHQDHALPWERLVWRDWHEVHVRADGTLSLPTTRS
jgi:hypothetical protein